MNLSDDPVRVIRSDELLAILKGLAMTNCDLRTLEIVAEQTLLGDQFRDYLAHTQRQIIIEVKAPLRLEAL